jgi:uncharacterized protein YciI
MLFVVEFAFDDDPRRLEARPAHRQQVSALHQAGTVLMAGPFADGSGALLVFEVADGEALDAVLAADPYYRAPGVTVVGRREFTPIVR